MSYREARPHTEAAELMARHGDVLLAESVLDIDDLHDIGKGGRCSGCLMAEWPCPEWLASNDRVLRWLVSKLNEETGGA